ncbi:MAG TPA: LysM peptidoglycan-binding domain-containing protein [Syntrophomonas sp.]|nr:LysM peptidoglycan-binding domain-containing protein [Syntrophomonas sp.]
MKKKTIIFLTTLVLWTLITTIALAVPANYAVQAGDTLWKISNTYGVSIDQIKKLNGLSSDFLNIGQKLILTSNTNQAAVTAPAVTVNNASTTNSGIYVVKSGDSLWAIANKFGTSIASIKALNGLSSDNLQVGQTLKISSSAAASTTPVSRSGDNISGTRLVEDAAQYLGTPYRYGGSGPGGFDCSGFTSYIFNRAGISLPRTAAGQYSVGTAVAQSDLQTGDLLFFAGGGSGIDHVGIYAGNGQMIHSSSPRSGGVIYTPLSSSYYANSYVGAKRVLR